MQFKYYVCIKKVYKFDDIYVEIGYSSFKNLTNRAKSGKMLMFELI